LKEGDEEKKQ